jgi:uracil-DNA glycosylase
MTMHTAPSPSAPLGAQIASQIAGALDWWGEAGVDTLFTDEPVTWLAEKRDPAAAPQRAATPLPAAFAEAIAAAKAPVTDTTEQDARIGGSTSAFPQDLPAFDAWWLQEPSLDGGHVEGRIAARGPVQAPLMVLVPQPEDGDAAAGQLLSGPQGALLRAMLAAMGLVEDTIRLAPALPRHMPHPDWPALNAQGLGDVLRHHVALAAPRRIIAFGGNILPLLGHNLPQNPAVLPSVNQEGAGNSPGKLDSAPAAPSMAPIMAMPDLATMLERPRAKAVFWHQWMNWQN